MGTLITDYPEDTFGLDPDEYFDLPQLDPENEMPFRFRVEDNHHDDVFEGTANEVFNAMHAQFEKNSIDGEDNYGVAHDDLKRLWEELRLGLDTDEVASKLGVTVLSLPDAS